MTAVRTSAKRLREPEILTPEEFQGLLGQLEPRERLLVLLAGTTGLRRGELIALRWEDIDFAKQVVKSPMQSGITSRARPKLPLRGNRFLYSLSSSTL
jgi:integrase